MSVTEAHNGGRYPGDTADVVAQIPVESFLASFREPDEVPTVKFGLTYEQAGRLAARLTGAVPDDWKAETYTELEGDDD